MKCGINYVDQGTADDFGLEEIVEQAVNVAIASFAMDGIIISEDQKQELIEYFLGNGVSDKIVKLLKKRAKNGRL